MADNIITNANDVELFLQADGEKRGTLQSMGRIVVDDFSITKEEDNSLESGVGFRLPAGVSMGDVTFNFSFTLLGDDVDVFQMVAEDDGMSSPFSLTAMKRDGDTIEWEVALDTCLAGTEEWSASSGDPMEYSVEGIAVSMEKTGVEYAN